MKKNPKCKACAGSLVETERSKKGDGVLKEERCLKCRVLTYVNREINKPKARKLRTWKFDAWTPSPHARYSSTGRITIYLVECEGDIPVSVVVTELPRKKK
jgi:hypothetical protein